MQAISKRLLRFKKLATTKASLVKPSFYKRNARWMLPSMGLVSTAFYAMNQNNFVSKFNFSTITATAEELHHKVEITGHEELENGQMMALKVGPKDDDKILIAKYQDKIYALSNF